MKKGIKTLAVVLLAFLLILASLAVWQRENIKIFLVSINHSAQTIDAMVLENEQQINRILNELADGNMHALSDDEIERLLSGELSEEEAIKIIMNKTDDSSQSDSKIDNIISRMFLLRAEYVKRLTTLENKAKSNAKEVFRQKTSVSEKLAFIEKYTTIGVNLEKECDARMKSLVRELETELETLGKDTAVISEVREYYKIEKKLKKSQLLSKYSKYLK